MMTGAGTRRFRWRRWHAVLVVLVALAADYLSPAALWTAALPLAFMAVLLSFGERRAALVVLFLSSWIAIPVAAGTVLAVDAARGVRRLFAVNDRIPGLYLEGELAASCNSDRIWTTRIELPDHGLIGRVVRTFADQHNLFALRSGWGHCAGAASAGTPDTRVME